VDDDASFRHEVAECLRSEGYAVVGAPHGRAGLDYLRTHEEPSFVLLDLTMPVMDGWELYREMKSDAALASIPIVVVSGLSRTPGERAMLDAEAYLEKPLRLERLLAIAEAHALRRDTIGALA
jgi:DNA-binding response OmpR family regulator